MAIEQLVHCDLCGEYLAKPDRHRVAVRRDQDRPESAEYLDVGPCCKDRTVGELLAVAHDHRPEDASGYKA